MRRSKRSRFDRLELFVPEGDRESKSTPVDLHDRWVVELLRVCADLFGGGTALGRGVGVWKSGGDIHWDRVTAIEVWVDRDAGREGDGVERLREKLMEMGAELRQQVVAYVWNGEMVRVSVGGQPA